MTWRNKKTTPGDDETFIPSEADMLEAKRQAMADEYRVGHPYPGDGWGVRPGQATNVEVLIDGEWTPLLYRPLYEGPVNRSMYCRHNDPVTKKPITNQEMAERAIADIKAGKTEFLRRGMVQRGFTDG